MSSHTLLGIGHLSMLGLKFNHVCERGPWRFVSPGFNSTTNSLIFLWKYDIMISYNCYIYHHSLFCFVLLCHQGFLGIEMGVTWHYGDVIMGTIASQITSLTIVYSTVYSDTDQRKHQSSASLAFVRGIHRGQVNSPHKCLVTRKMCPFDDVIMVCNVILLDLKI